jgi:DNA invertase Pin-like site-specific DNA recombinase
LTLISAKHPEQFRDSGITANLIRQILGAVAEFDRSQLVERLKQGRVRKAKVTSKCTLSNKPRTCGVKSRLDRKDGPLLAKTLFAFAKKKYWKKAI